MRCPSFRGRDDDGAGDRRIVLIVGVLLVLIGLVTLIGPSDVLVILHLKESETEPDLFLPSANGDAEKTYITVDELAVRVVNIRPRLETFAGFPYGTTELSGKDFYYFPVEYGFEIEFCTEGNSAASGPTVLSVTLYDASDKSYRLSLTDGVPLEVLDEFLSQKIKDPEKGDK